MKRFLWVLISLIWTSPAIAASAIVCDIPGAGLLGFIQRIDFKIDAGMQGNDQLQRGIASYSAAGFTGEYPFLIAGVASGNGSAAILKPDVQHPMIADALNKTNSRREIHVWLPVSAPQSGETYKATVAVVDVSIVPHEGSKYQNAIITLVDLAAAKVHW